MGTGGYQFVHVEGYSRKSDARGRSVNYVLSEAERQPDACTHIAAALPPEVVYGVSLANLRAVHDERAAAAIATIAGGKTRKVRKDQVTLLTVVASHPATIAEVHDDPDIAADVASWERRVIDWLRDRWGDDLATVVRHGDERYAHLHAYILPSDAEMRARKLHPGVSAKEAAKFEAVTEGADAKTANAVGDRAYRAAMREMQDAFWRSVGIPCRLTRIGPARRRLTRAAWHAEKAGVAAAAEAIQVARTARTEAEAAKQDSIIATGAAEAEKVAAQSLQAQADVAARRAKAAINAAREQAAEAKAAADAAHRERAEAERQARIHVARGRRLVAQARAEAHRVVNSARAEAERMQRGAHGIGAWLGALVHGLRGMAPAKVAREAAAIAQANERALTTARASVLHNESELTKEELRLARTRLVAVSEAVATLGEQRDRLARELDRLRPDHFLNTAPNPRPR